MPEILLNPPDLDALDVALTWGDRPESTSLLRYLNDPEIRGILVTGAAGIGKTGMVNAVIDTPNPRFPGGILEVDESEISKRSFSLPSLPNTSAPTIILVDCQSRHPPKSMLNSYERVSRGRSHKYIIIARTEAIAASRLKLPDGFVTLEVEGFAEAEFVSVARSIARYIGPRNVGKRAILELHRLSDGNPGILANAFMLFRSGVRGSIEEMVTNLRDFRASVIWGPDGEPILFSQAKRIIVDVGTANAEVLRLLQKSPDLSWSLPSRRFEEIVAEILNGMGYDVILTPKSKDGGFDIRAAQKTGLGKFLYLVECKRYTPPDKVGVEIVRRVNGLIDPRTANKAAIVTTSFFTSGARAFHREVEHRVDLHDYVTFQQWLRDFSHKR